MLCGLRQKLCCPGHHCPYLAKVAAAWWEVHSTDIAWWEVHITDIQHEKSQRLSAQDFTTLSIVRYRVRFSADFLQNQAPG